MSTNLSDKSYADFSALVKQKLGIILGDSKQYLVKSRLSVLMRNLHYADLDSLVADAVSGRMRQVQVLALDAMTTNETFWFRDQYPFQILQDVIFRDLYKKQKTVRIWSAACSSGQEPYSIAMSVIEYQQRHRQYFDKIEIIATDISEQILTLAATATYDTLAVSRGLSTERLATFFKQVEQKWQLNPEVRRLVSFRQFNLLDNYSMLGKFDIIFCRNVLIYFDDPTKAAILQKFSAQLPPEGSLFLGAAESLGSTGHLYKMQKQPQGLYYSKV